MNNKCGDICGCHSYCCYPSQAQKQDVLLAEDDQKVSACKKSLFATAPPNYATPPKTYPGIDSLPKTITELWNQADLRYFDSHLDKAHREGKIVLVGKDVYYKNIMLFVQCLQNLVIFRNAVLVKGIIAISLQSSALE